MSGAENGAVIRLRPGAVLSALSSDELQISFPNYTATFTSPAVTKGVATIVQSIGEGAPREVVVQRAARAAALEEAFVEYLVESLIASHCIAVGARDQPMGPLFDFYAYLGVDVNDVAERLREARCTLVRLGDEAPRPDEALRELGLDVEPIEAAPGTSSAAPLAALEKALDATALVGCWNVPYRSPFARLVNELAAQKDVPVLFGACEGVVGRVGPFVIPGNTACLECVTTRLLAHAGGPELRAYREYRLRNEEVVPEPWPSHPLFVQAVAAFYGVELLRTTLREGSPATGGFVEYRFGDFASERHSALRLPGCPVCRPQAPRRLAWDARFPAPAVKGSAE